MSTTRFPPVHDREAWRHSVLDKLDELGRALSADEAKEMLEAIQAECPELVREAERLLGIRVRLSSELDTLLDEPMAFPDDTLRERVASIAAESIDLDHAEVDALHRVLSVDVGALD
ncbi:MAG: hypothetical protein HY791_11635 [Deltaproteobacteria bacterium]|nr:hypothetical protein [Deltaproteobacteria bacterium]